MLKKAIIAAVILAGIAAVAWLAIMIPHQLKKQALKPLLKPYQTAQLPDFGGIPFYQMPPKPANTDILPFLGIQSDPRFNCRLKNPEQLKVLSDFIGINAPFMTQATKQWFAANPANIVNSYKHTKAICKSLGGAGMTAKFYRVHLEYEISQNSLTGALNDLGIIHRVLTEQAKFPYVSANTYFISTLWFETAAVGRILNCFKLTPSELEPVVVILNESEELQLKSFNNAISGAAYYLLFAPMAERQNNITNQLYILTILEPEIIPPVEVNYSLKGLWRRERFFMKYLAFANAGLFDFSNYRNVEKGWTQYQEDLKNSPISQSLQRDVDLFELYQSNLRAIAQLRFAKIAVAVRSFEDKNQRLPSSLEELIKQNLITAADTVNPFFGEAIQWKQGVFPVLQEYRNIDNCNQDRYEDCPTIRLSCPTPQRTLQYFVVNKPQ